MDLRYLISSIFVSVPLLLQAQTSISFDAEDFSGIRIYDSWEESPFRTGCLEGNAAVISNFLCDETNPSSGILAVQRSRYGSNTFGVSVGLKETFELTPQVKYVNLMVHRPYGGRVMVIGLGKRRDRKVQPETTEQFWAMSRSDVPAGSWQWLSLPVKGNGGIDIYSLVVVPDCESPHGYAEDAICYIDNISVTDVPMGEVMKKAAALGHAPGQCVVNTANRNGEVLSSDGVTLDNHQVPEGTPFEVRAVPAPGFFCSGVVVRSAGGQVCLDVREDDTCLIPAEAMKGNVFVEGVFVEER